MELSFRDQYNGCLGKWQLQKCLAHIIRKVEFIDIRAQGGELWIKNEKTIGWRDCLVKCLLCKSDNLSSFKSREPT